MSRSRTTYPVRAAIAALTAALFAVACTSGKRPDAPPAAAATVAAKADPVASVNAIADRYVAAVMDFDPTITYPTGVPVASHDRLPRNSKAEIAAAEAVEDTLIADLDRVDAAALRGTPAAATYAVLREQLDAARGLRVCHAERWSINHMGGWQVSLPEAAASQPVDTPQARDEAIRRWASLPQYLDNDMANLREGLATGYAVPKAIVARVVRQLDGALAAKAEQWPFFSPAERSDDAAFKTRMRETIDGAIRPAVQRYRDFLANEYAPKARDGMALSDLPDGAACYAAQLRLYTTLPRSPQAVYDLGRKTVADYLATIDAKLIAPHAVGEGFTAVDAFLLVFYRWGNIIGIDMRTAYPNYARFAEGLGLSASVMKTLQAEGVRLEGAT